jgi:hypothetical protein
MHNLKPIAALGQFHEKPAGHVHLFVILERLTAK